MTPDAKIAYETKTVRVVRGMESRTIKKWEGDGWQVVDQTPGKLKTEIAFRRPAPRSRRLLWIAAGSVLTVALAAVIVVGVISEKNPAPAESASVASSAIPESSEQTAPSSAGKAPTSSPESRNAVLTRENSPEFAALLKLTDTCSPDIAAFAAAHRGQKVSFPGSIVAMAPHNGAKTRYDILINAGDFSATISRPGPNFQFRDENTVSDLHFVGEVPDTIGIGTNLNITAEVDRYVEKQCLFLLEPVATAFR